MSSTSSSSNSIHSVFISQSRLFTCGIQDSIISLIMSSTASPPAVQQPFWNFLWPKTPTIFQASASLFFLLVLVLLGESLTLVLASILTKLSIVVVSSTLARLNLKTHLRLVYWVHYFGDPSATVGLLRGDTVCILSGQASESGKLTLLECANLFDGKRLGEEVNAGVEDKVLGLVKLTGVGRP